MTSHRLLIQYYINDFLTTLIARRSMQSCSVVRGFKLGAFQTVFLSCRKWLDFFGFWWLFKPYICMNKNVTVIFRCREIAIAVLHLNLTNTYLKTKLCFDGLLLLESLCSKLFYILRKKLPVYIWTRRSLWRHYLNGKQKVCMPFHAKSVYKP